MTIHPKVWGEERWIVNRDYCGKLLILNEGYRCSMHRHEVKDETFYVLSGAVLMEVDDDVRVLLPGESAHIPVGAWHRFTGLFPSQMIEFSTHHEDVDSIRSTQSEAVPRNEFLLLRSHYL